ncbi:MAG: DUF3486 family protein [Pseudohongiella nitratireducens]|nr:DUF3486 family protein [Pseudohongiella nitratireducens]MDF1622512.1 DUF3486 family protein [Pseudohongiella nitratireducens]
MPAISKLQQLPAEVKAWLDARLVKNGFGNYDDLTAQLNAKLEEHGLEITVSRSGLGIYGKAMKDRIEKITASTQAAKLLNESMDDDGDALGMANVALAQDLIFQLMNKYDPDDTENKISVKEISTLFRALGNISRASLPQKQWSKKIREELARKKAEAISQIQAEAGLSDEQFERVRARFLGIDIDG